MWKKNSFMMWLIVIMIIADIKTLSAFDVEQVINEITQELSQNLQENPKSNPVLILVGGYPGAGKTTLINALTQTRDLCVISWNAIRQALSDKGLKGSPHDPKIIDAVNKNLLRICLKRHVNIIIDANAHAKNVKLFESLLKEEGYQETYQLIKICLNPPLEMNLNRIRKREPNSHFHQGMESDLIRDINSSQKKINMNDYSLIIKNDEKISFETEMNIINAFIQPFFAQQK